MHGTATLGLWSGSEIIPSTAAREYAAVNQKPRLDTAVEIWNHLFLVLGPFQLSLSPHNEDK